MFSVLETNRRHVLDGYHGSVIHMDEIPQERSPSHEKKQKVLKKFFSNSYRPEKITSNAKLQ